MTSRAGQELTTKAGLRLSQANIESRIYRDQFDGMIAAIEQEVRDEIKAVIEAELAVASDAPDGFDSGALAAYHHVLAAISSSSATETQDGERCGAPAVGGPCVLPRAHNMGYVDIPERHRAATPTPDDRDREVKRIATVCYCRMCTLLRDLDHLRAELEPLQSVLNGILSDGPVMDTLAADGPWWTPPDPTGVRLHDALIAASKAVDRAIDAGLRASGGTE